MPIPWPIFAVITAAPVAIALALLVVGSRFLQMYADRLVKLDTPERPDLYRFLGDEVRIVTPDNIAFAGSLVHIGDKSLTIAPSSITLPSGDAGPVPDGVLVFPWHRITYVQVS